MNSKPQSVGFARRALRLCIFGIPLLAASCSRYPDAETVQAQVVAAGELGETAETHAPNLDPSLLSKWNQLVQETIEQSARERCVALIINRYRHTLNAYKNGYRVAEYGVDFGPDAAPKRLREDGATPEGKYEIVEKLGPGETKNQRVLVMDYSDAQRRRHGFRMQRHTHNRQKIGGNIAIHGTSDRDKNWTLGDIALDNESFDDMFPYVLVGTPVTIVADETIQPDRKHYRGQ